MRPSAVAMRGAAAVGLVFCSRSLVCLQRQQFRRRGGDNNGGCSSDAPGAVQGPVPTNFPVMNFGASSSSSLLPTDESSTQSGTMRTLKLNEAEEFFFRGQQSLVSDDSAAAAAPAGGPQSGGSFHHHNHRTTSFCRLCQEDVVAPFNPRSHILGSSRTTHTNHSCREAVLDTLAIVLARGYPADKMPLVWANSLFHHPRGTFPRISALSDPSWSLAKRGEKLLELLKLLSDVGVIDIAYAVIAPEDPLQQVIGHRRRVAMERTECIGDNSWGHHMSHRMITLFPDRQFAFSQFSYTYNCFRDACEMNVTLEWIYDVLQISLLFPVPLREKIGNGKMKADILEAILGELHLSLFGYMPQLYDNQQYVEVNGEGERLLVNIIEHVMAEIFDMIILHFVGEMMTTALPLANEIAVNMLWRTARSQLSKHKDRTGSLRRRNQSLQQGRSIQLPPLLGLTLEAKATPTGGPHPLRRSDFTLPETTTYNGRDALEDMIPHLKAADPSERFRDTAVMEVIAADRLSWARLRESLQLGLEDSTLGVVDDEEQYFRDPYFNLTSSPGAVDPLPLSSSSDGPRGHDAMSAAGLVYPRLQEQPSAPEDLDNGPLRSGGAGGSTVGLCFFEPSRFVPAGVKPPVAGVVTDKNLHSGLFLFAAHRQKQRGEKSPNNALSDAVVTGDVDASVTAEGAGDLADGLEKQQQQQQSASVMDVLMDEWQRRASVDNDYFPALVHGFKFSATAATATETAAAH